MELFKGPSDEEVVNNINRLVEKEPLIAFDVYKSINAKVPDNKKEKYLKKVKKEIIRLAEEGRINPETLFLSSSSINFFEGIKKAFEINDDPQVPSKNKINQRTFTLPIHNALKQKRYDIAKYLIKNGQKYISENTAGKLLLDIIRAQRVDIIELLLDNYNIPQEYLEQAKNIGEKYSNKIYELLINKINNSN